MAIEITYRRTSRLSMRIVKNGDVHVSVPIGYPSKLVDEFIAEHADWIESARKRNAERVKGQDDFFSKLPLQTRAQANFHAGVKPARKLAGYARIRYGDFKVAGRTHRRRRAQATH
ncbi:MAG: DUF45 domain-containing protein [Paludibacteraceae bacterium]|nr:DUF45 domain-containing protein [Paludibacteraceae bacterium]MBO7368273.1 DUF45 domain-containing protein [Paludibacteraceae bacterium]